MRSPGTVAVLSVLVLSALACGGGAAQILDLRFTNWDCYEGSGYEGVLFMAEGRCSGSSVVDWTCSWTQDANDFVITWTGPGGQTEIWEGAMVDTRGLEMGGVTNDGAEVHDFRCTRAQ